MAETPSTSAAGTERLEKIGRLLADLKVTAEYLRQYPSLAERVAALVEEAGAVTERPVEGQRQGVDPPAPSPPGPARSR
jgi:hypothetical protein